MKFVDEAIIKVQGGNGGRGAVSFRREKFVPFGGPDGGDGGDGASIYLVAAPGINSLADFRFRRAFRADHGESGSGNDCTGACGQDLEVSVPIGTVIFDADTNEEMGDLTQVGDRVIVAKGGKGGWGNARFKSSTNRTPRKAMPGLLGEKRDLRLELRLIADVGLLGFPNAGKSTLIRAVSAARPKVADYPFTTLYPNLGVVSVGFGRSFVMADIPGLIEGAAEGAGLGLQFLRHLQRTHILLHLVDICPPDPDADPVKDARAIVAELKKYSPELAPEGALAAAEQGGSVSARGSGQTMQGHRATAAFQGTGIQDFRSGEGGNGRTGPGHHEEARRREGRTGRRPGGTGAPGIGRVGKLRDLS